MPAALRARHDGAILKALTESALYRKSQSVFAFVSVGEEVNTYPILEAALSAGKKVYIPFLPRGGKEMLAVPLIGLSGLAPGAYGIPTSKEAQESPDAHALTPPHIDLCLTPGLLFDRQGYRIGYGGGYYDRFIARSLAGACVGLCYAAQISVFPLPHDPWDQPVSYLLSENGLFAAG